MSKVQHHSHSVSLPKHIPKKNEPFCYSGLVTETRFNEAIFELKQENKELRKEMNFRFDYIKQDIDHRFEMVDRKFENVDKKFEEVDKKFQEMTMKIDSTANATKESLLASIELKIAHNTNKLIFWNFGLIGTVLAIMAKGFGWF